MSTNLYAIDPNENDQNDGENSERSDDDDDEDEEMPDDGMVEKAFKFDDFAKRLLNPKIVRACVVVLSDWEQIATKSLKAAVTILHRIAYGCSCPAMLYQAKLFRIFQQVFHAGRDAHCEELRRLGIFVVRKFVETAPSNPKIYAELLFYKTIKEANELESGYCDVYESGTKGTWSEEQESELRFLFEENQRNPATDMDVIDWILANISDKTRTRRGILKKLKEMNLMFKAPTKKSTAAAYNKNLWRSEEDEELQSLYDQYRTENDCLQRIVDEFAERRNKQAIIKRMLQLHIIADKSEILPEKPRKRKSNKQNNGEDHGEYDFIEEPTFEDFDTPSVSRQSKAIKSNQKIKERKIVRTPLDVGTLRVLINQIDKEKFQEAIDWLKECLEDADEDVEEDAEEDDGVPLVPLQQIAKDAMEDDSFKKVLVALGIQPPVFGMESYWRIPTYLNSADLKLRAKIVAGDDIEINVEDLQEDDNATDNESATENYNNRAAKDESEEEDYLETLGMAKERKKLENLENYMDQRREKLKSLMFSKSDDETEERVPINALNKIKAKKAKKPKENSKAKEEKLHKYKQFNDELSSEDEESVTKIDKKSKEKESSKPMTRDLFDELKSQRAQSKIKLSGIVAKKNDNTEQEDDINLDFNSEDYRKRLLELGDDDDKENADEVEEVEPDTIIENSHKYKRSRRPNVIESDSDDNDDVAVDNANKGNNKNKQFDNDLSSIAEGSETNTFKKPKQKEITNLMPGDMFDQLKSRRGASEIEKEDDINLDFNSEDYRKRLLELGDDDNENVEQDKIMENSHEYKHSRHANVIVSDSDDNDDVAVDTANLGNNKNKHNVSADNNDVDKHDVDDGFNIEGDSSTASTRKRQRSLDAVDNEYHKDDNDEDEDVNFLKRKQLSPSTHYLETDKKPTKRRRVAVIDDDDEDD